MAEKLALTVYFQTVSLKIPVPKKTVIADLMIEAAKRFREISRLEDQVTVDMLQDRSGAILYGKDTVEDVCTDGLTLYAEYTINGIKYPALLPPVSPDPPAALSSQRKEIVYKDTDNTTDSAIRSTIEIFAKYFFAEVYQSPGLTYKGVQEFQNKTNGKQNGCVALVTFKNHAINMFETIRFFLKTHLVRRAFPEPLDPRKVFIYTYLEQVGIGAQVEFIFDLTNYNNVFTASREVEPYFRTFNVAADDSIFLNEFKHNREHLKALVWVELIGRILFMTNVYENLSNFGFLRFASSYEDIRVIDFTISDDHITKRENMLERFHKDSLKYPINMVQMSLDEKKKYAREIMRSKAVQLVQCIDVALKRTESFFENSQYRAKLKAPSQLVFDTKQRMFNVYIDMVKANISMFIEHFSS